MDDSFINDTARELASGLVVILKTGLDMLNSLLKAIPFSTQIMDYCRRSYQHDPLRILLEIMLVVFMVWYSFKNKPRETEQLTESEIQELIAQWEPEPLVPALTPDQKADLDKVLVTVGQPGLKLKTSDGRERLNFASFNYLGIMNAESIKEKSIVALRKYGVGSCGPPGFYGTIDVHLELESSLATFIGHQDAIIYAQGFACTSSAIPAFSKRGDVIVADEACSFAIQKGIQISRSDIFWFKHNDMQDLENVLARVGLQRKKQKKPLARQFIVVEGVYANVGDICPLHDLLALKLKYKYRLIVDESHSFGVLGKRGAGICDHFDVKATEVDIILATLSNSIASAGGFCAGSKAIVEHQRLSGQAYTFSASLPAMLAVASLEALKMLQNDQKLLIQLADNSKLLHSLLDKMCTTGALVLTGTPASPLFHLVGSDALLQLIVDLSFKDGLVLVRAKYIADQEHSKSPQSSIRITASAGFTKREVERGCQILREAIKRAIRLVKA